MGNQLDESAHMRPNVEAIPPTPLTGSVPSWVDHRTAALVQAVVASLAQYPESQAVILFGSVSRHDERPLTDSEPSDLDLLLLVDSGAETGRLPLDREVTLRMDIGCIEDCYRDVPREVQITIVERDLASWDPLFVETVARDGILLWARGPLPEPFKSITERAARHATKPTTK